MANLRRAPLLLTFALALTLSACGADDADDATADEPADEVDDEDTDDMPSSLEGELITLLVGTSPGGGYDSYARIVAPFYADQFGADVTVENMDGAGGLLMLNSLWTSEPDGTMIAIMNGPGTLGSVLGGSEGVEFELDQFTYLGRIAGEPRVLAVNAERPYESAEDLLDLTDEFRFSSTGPGGSTFNDAAFSLELFNMESGDIVSGFDGSEEAILAVTAGEVDAIISTADTIIPHVEAGDHRALAVLGTERIEELPDVPTLVELPFEGEQMAIAETMAVIPEVGRIFIAPPGVPDDLLAQMRQVLEDVAGSAEFLDEAENQGRPIGFLGGEETRELMVGALDAPPIMGQILSEAASD
jgi:tripartite-type tricarboxylate transporter receptor subunit TctC